MTNYKPRPLQKFSLFMGWLSFILAIVCVVFFFIKKAELGIRDPITTSFMAAVFFFICVGGLLFVLGKTNLPDLTVRARREPDKLQGDKEGNGEKADGTAVSQAASAPKE